MDEVNIFFIFRGVNPDSCNLILLTGNQQLGLLIVNALQHENIAAAYTLAENNTIFREQIKAIGVHAAIAYYPEEGYDIEEAIIDVNRLLPNLPILVIAEAGQPTNKLKSLIRNGAADYIITSDIDRLPVTLLNAIEKYSLKAEQEHYFTELTARKTLMKDAERLAHFGSWREDISTGRLYWSDEKFRILGYLPGAIVPSWDNFYSKVHPDDINFVKNTMAEAMASRNRQKFTFRILSARGIIKYIHSELFIIRDIELNVVWMNGFLRDISEHTEAEMKLVESEEKYYDLFENNPVALLVADITDNRVIDANRAALKLYGYRRDELEHLKLNNLLPSSGNREPEGNSVNTLLNTISTGAAQHITKYKELIDVEVSISEIIFEGRHTRLFVIKDITDELRTIKRMQQSEANLRSIFENTETIYVLLNLDLKILSFNTQAEIFAEKHFYAALNTEAYALDFFASDTQNIIKKSLMKAARGSNLHFEACYPDVYGVVKWYNAHFHPVWSKQREILGIIMSFRDITERKYQQIKEKKITEDLIRRNKDLEQFAYIISHNLRAPVANIMGIASILNSDDIDEKEQQTFLTDLQDSIKNLDTIIFDLNRILQMKNHINEVKETVLFSQLVADVKQGLSGLDESDIYQINTDFTQASEITTLKSYLYSVFYNLISNSIKYKQPNIIPVINIFSELKDNILTLHFKDNGLGINLERYGGQLFGLYKRFHQYAAEGKGMGLFMVKTQVETMGGKINVLSRPNEGTEFIIEFELTRE